MCRAVCGCWLRCVDCEKDRSETVVEAVKKIAFREPIGREGFDIGRVTVCLPNNRIQIKELRLSFFLSCHVAFRPQIDYRLLRLPPFGSSKRQQSIHRQASTTVAIIFRIVLD